MGRKWSVVDSRKSLQQSNSTHSFVRGTTLSYLGHLTKLPEKIGNLKNLESLNLFGDDIRTLPKSMSKMKKLEWLNVYDDFNLSESYKGFLPKRLWLK